MKVSNAVIVERIFLSQVNLQAKPLIILAVIIRRIMLNAIVKQQTGYGVDHLHVQVS